LVGPLVVEHVRWHQIEKISEGHDTALEAVAYKVVRNYPGGGDLIGGEAIVGERQ
jgi:hypothetical protein